MKQNKTPIQHEATRRYDRGAIRTSGRAGKVVPVAYMPILRGDSASGQIAINVDLAPMPRPLLNSVILNAQAWFVPKDAHPQFASHSDFVASYQGEAIKRLGASDQTAPALFAFTGVGPTGEIMDTLGVHTPDNHCDVVDAYNLIQNFRRQARSKALSLRPYTTENAQAQNLARAFWPPDALTAIVPDYERALVVGNLDFDLAAGSLPVKGLMRQDGAPLQDNVSGRDVDGATVYNKSIHSQTIADSSVGIGMEVEYTGTNWNPKVFADLTAQGLTTTLAGIDRARELQSFAQLRASYSGLGVDDFSQDRQIIADLMQGLGASVRDLRHPFLLDSRQVAFATQERFSTDATDLEASLTEGMATVNLSLNVPKSDPGGVIVVTIEVCPERIHEAQADEWLAFTSADQFPDATRDMLNPEPVDEVYNRRVDARHTNPDAIYGYEPMNAMWNREFTRLGGVFKQDDPAATSISEQRANLWLVNVVDPEFTEDHYLCPAAFPHDVFADTLAPAFEVTARHDLSVTGLTVFGDQVFENTDDYAAVTAE